MHFLQTVSILAKFKDQKLHGPALVTVASVWDGGLVVGGGHPYIVVAHNRNRSCKTLADWRMISFHSGVLITIFVLLVMLICTAAITVFPSQGLIGASITLGYDTASSTHSSATLEVTANLTLKDSSRTPLSIIKDGISLLQIRLCQGAADASNDCDPPMLTTIMLPVGPDSQATYAASIPIPRVSIASNASIRIDHLKQTLPCDASKPARFLRCVAVDCITVCPFDAEEVKDPTSGRAALANDANSSITNVASFDIPHAQEETALMRTDLPSCYRDSSTNVTLARGFWLSLVHPLANVSILPPYLKDHGFQYFPTDCGLSFYLPSAAAACLRRYSRIVMVGDSLTRTTFEYIEKFIQLHDDTEPFHVDTVKYHGPQQRSTAGINMSLLFNQGVSLLDWHPNYRVSKRYTVMPDNPREQIVIIQPSRWEMYMPLHLYEKNIRNMLQSFIEDFVGKVIFVFPEPSRELNIRFDLLMRNASMNVIRDPVVAAKLFRVVDVFPAINNFRILSVDGVHYSGFLSRWKMNAMMNVLCN